MKDIHAACVDIAREYGDVGNYVLGANIAGFIMVANSVIDQGIVSFPGRRSGLRAAGTAQASPPLFVSYRAMTILRVSVSRAVLTR